MKHRIVLVLILALSLLLSACGTVDGAEGEYLCIALSANGTDFASDYLFDPAPRLSLGAGGRGKLSVNGETGSIRWTREADSLTVTAGSRTLSGSIADGVAELRFSDSGVTATFVREELAARDFNESSNALAARWAGDWYGWWEISGSTGTLPDTWYDCFASVEVLTDGSARMRIWDEQSSRDEPIGFILLSLEEERATALGGRFWFQELEEGAWVLDLTASPFADMVLVNDATHEGGGESFHYRLCLRPWGRDWEDVREAGDARIPYYYDTWARPLMENGASMPDRLDG